MAEKITYRFLPEDKCLTERQLFDYIDQKLSAADMHLVEKHLLACDMCSDALEGLEKVKHREKVAAFFPAGILNPTTKNDSEASPTKVIPLHPNRKYYAIAAGLILIIGVSIYFKMNVSNDMESAKTADLAQKDSSVASVIVSPEKSTLEKSDCLSSRVTTVNKDEVAREKDLRGDDRQRSDYWNKFGLADTLRQTNEESGPKDNLKSQNQLGSQQDVVSAVPDETTEQPVLEQPKNLQQNQKEDKDLAKTEQKKAEAQSANDDLAETDIKTKEPAKDKDKYSYENNHDNSASGKTNDNKAVAHEATTPASQQATVASQGTAAPANAGGMSTGSSSTILTDSETNNVATNADSVSVNTPRMFPLAPSEKDLDLSYENGVKMLDSGQATASLVFFDEVLKNPNHHYYEDAQWKKALALIQLNRKAEAKTLLEEIVKKGGRFKSQAETELKKL